MTPFLLAYVAGALSIAAPSVMPVLPLALPPADRSFRRGDLVSMLTLASAFAIFGSLVALAGSWALGLGGSSRFVAMGLVVACGLGAVFPGLTGTAASGLWRRRASKRPRQVPISPWRSTLALWGPPTAPLMGLALILAALRGPGLETTLLLLVYALGAVSALTAASTVARPVRAALRARPSQARQLRHALGVAAVVSGLVLSPAIWAAVRDGNHPAANPLFPAGQLDDVATAAVSATLPSSSPLSSLTGARSWLNTAPLRPEDLRGKVVLVNFWTYSCINSLRALPYLRTWAEKYKAQGLVVVGVHTPEFTFEKDPAHVRRASASLGIAYPVVLDSDYRIWRAFDNQAWPALYFVDAEGRMRRKVLGEGGYDASERLIQKMLSEARGAPVDDAVVEIVGQGAQAPPDFKNLRSPETYVGYAQARGFASATSLRRDASASYRLAPELALNTWGLSGAWNVESEFATLTRGPGAIAYRFHGRDLHMVLAPASPGRPVRFRVTVDGAPPGLDHGSDVNPAGVGQVDEPRMYQLVRQRRPIADRTVRVEFLDPGVQAYVFTFG